MIIDKATPTIPTGTDIRVWRQGSGFAPDWVVHAAIGDLQPNGTFLIETALGQQRVHQGHLVVEQAGQIYACAPDEVEARVAELRSRVAEAGSPRNIIGPGKSLKTAIPSRRRKSERAPVARTRAFPQARGTLPTIEWVHVSELQVDDDYQRSIKSSVSQRLIASIATHWDWRLCMPLAVSRRSDGRYVIDGQHRLAAAKLRADLPQLPCCVATYDGPADEAAMFVAANRARRAINRLDDFHAALVAGDEDAIEVNRVVRAAGLRVSRNTGSQSWAPGEVAFTSSIQTVLGRHGEALVEEALRAIATSFSGQVLSNGASLFLALTRILISPPANLDRDRLQRCVQSLDMNGWSQFVQGVKGGDARAQTMRIAILEAYNDPHRAQRAAA